ncbi:MAG: hypothetical protein HY904_02935 [Deltaproteobacteria bacterium]|nr:hypothetical protein [Deltaproteobacteria bacterium]
MSRRHPPAFSLGQDVMLDMAPYIAKVKIIEDRGPIGVGGRRLWRVRLDPGPDYEPMELEVPEMNLKPLEQWEAATR